MIVWLAVEFYIESHSLYNFGVFHLLHFHVALEKFNGTLNSVYSGILLSPVL